MSASCCTTVNNIVKYNSTLYYNIRILVSYLVSNPISGNKYIVLNVYPNFTNTDIVDLSTINDHNSFLWHIYRNGGFLEMIYDIGDIQKIREQWGKKEK